MPELRSARSNKQRERYSRLICLGCRARRIRCELPDDIEVPRAGELRTVSTPCYRCKKIGIPCIIRQTVLGRPGSKNPRSASDLHLDSKNEDFAESGVVQPNLSRGCSKNAPAKRSSALPRSLDPLERSSLSQDDHLRTPDRTLLIHIPQSNETGFIIHAIDTLRREKVEHEWFRHLPARFGHATALDLSTKALVAACTHSRGLPGHGSSDCFQALSLALNALQISIKQAHGKVSDEILASTALLAPFEGVVDKHGILTMPHVNGLAGILAARPSTYPVTELARDIVDFHAGESSLMACVQGTVSPFDGIHAAYFVNNRTGCSDCDQAQLRAIGTELFMRLPRLVRYMRMLRIQSPMQDKHFIEACHLAESLSTLQDASAEEKLMKCVQAQPCRDATSSVSICLEFASVKDFEALSYYWQTRLLLLRLQWRLHRMEQNSGAGERKLIRHDASILPMSVETIRLANNIIMASEYAETLPLRKQVRLFAHAMAMAWGVMRDIPAAFEYRDPGLWSDSLSDFLLRRLHAVLAQPDVTAHDMDEAAEIFVGGEAKGRFAELFGLQT